MALTIIRRKWPRGGIREDQQPLEEHIVKQALDARDAAETYMREHLAAFEGAGYCREHGFWYVRDAEFEYRYIIE